MSLNNLLDQTLQFFEKGYKEINFTKSQNQDIFVKYNYLKIDGNEKF